MLLQAIAALNKALGADPTSLEVLLSLGVSHTNELDAGKPGLLVTVVVTVAEACQRMGSLCAASRTLRFGVCLGKGFTVLIKLVFWYICIPITSSLQYLASATARTCMSGPQSCGSRVHTRRVLHCAFGHLARA